MRATNSPPPQGHGNTDHPRTPPVDFGPATCRFLSVEKEDMDPEVEDDAAAEAAFNEGSGGEAVKADEATPTATPETPEATPATEVVAPKYAQITEDQFNALNAKVASIDEMKATMEKSFGTAFGKIGGLERKQSAIEEWKASQGITGEMTEDDFVEMKDSFPEFVDMNLKAFNRAMTRMKGTSAPTIDPAKIDELVQRGIELKLSEREAKQLAEEQDKAKARLTKAHPDWVNLRDAPDFKAWKDAQPADFREEFEESWDPRFVSKAFSTFKAAQAKAKEAADKAAADLAAKSSTTRKDRLAAAVNPRGTGGHAPGPSEDDDFEAGFRSG